MGPFLYCLVTAPKSPSTWLYATILVVYMNIAGTVANAIHGNQWAQYNMWTGEYIYINPYMQRQFQLEGYAAATLLTLSSLFFLCIIHFIPKMKSAWKRRVMFLVFMGLLLLSLNGWMAMYCYKNPTYPFKYYFDVFELAQWFTATVYEFTGISLRPQ